MRVLFPAQSVFRGVSHVSFLADAPKLHTLHISCLDDSNNAHEKTTINCIIIESRIKDATLRSFQETEVSVLLINGSGPAKVYTSSFLK